MTETAKQALSLLSVGLSLVGFAIYYASILRGRTRPHIFSWLIWSLLQIIGSFAQLRSGAGVGVWPVATSALLCFIVAVLAFRCGETNITRSDWCAFIGALTALPVWQITRNPLGAILVVTAIDALAFYPTLRKTYVNPYQEDYRLYAIDLARWIPGLLALEDYTLTTMLFQSYVMLADAVIVGLIFVRRRQLRQAEA